jgi:hypothetical protein
MTPKFPKGGSYFLTPAPLHFGEGRASLSLKD